jgi:hypothetical protein
VTIEQNLDGPGFREDLGVFHGGSIDDVIRTVECPTFNNVKLVAMVIPNAVKPGWACRVVVYVPDIYHQRVPFPSGARVSQIEVDSGKMRAVVEIDVAVAVDEFVCNLYPIRSLCDLKGERDIRDARHPRFEAICVRVLGAILEILLPPG